MKNSPKKYMFGGALYNTAKAFGANDTIANTLGMVGGAAGMFVNPLAGGMEAAQYGVNLAKKEMKFGGLIEDTFDKVEGPSHAEGGVAKTHQHELEGGEFQYKNMVFSNVNDYSKRATKIASKYRKRGEDKMALEAMDQELSNLFAQQESDAVILKGRKQMKYGGKMKYQFGGPTGGVNNPNEYIPDGITDPTLMMDSGSLGLFPTHPMNAMIPGAQTMNTKQYSAIKNTDGSYGFNVDMSMENPIPLKGIDSTRPDAYKKATPLPLDGGTKSQPVTDTSLMSQTPTISPWGAVLNSVGPMAQLAGTLIQGVDDVDLERMKPNLVNYGQERTIAQRNAGNAMAVNRMNAKNNSRSSGQLLSNLVGGNVGINQNLNNAIGSSIQNEQNTNVGILNNTNQMNTQIANTEKELRQQNLASYRQAIYGALGNMGNIGAGYMRDNNMMAAQDLQNKRALEILNSLPYRYGWDSTQPNNGIFGLNVKPTP